LRTIAAMPDARGVSDMAVAGRVAFAVVTADAHAVSQTASAAAAAPARPGELMVQRRRAQVPLQAVATNGSHDWVPSDTPWSSARR
jgi:hypothetical protein